MARFDLSDREWAILEPLLPRQVGRGGRWRDHRQVINGIMWVKRTGSPWRDMPERYGPWTTANERFVLWARDGTWARLKRRVIALAEAEGAIDWNAQADSTVVRAHQHAAGARKGGSMPPNRSNAKGSAGQRAASVPRSTLWPTGAAGRSPR
jgi:transposase